MNKTCNKHGEPVPMFLAVIDFHFHKIKIGYYCIKCHNFIPINNPEIEFYGKLLPAGVPRWEDNELMEV